MNIKRIHINLLLMLFLVLTGYSQDSEITGYKIEGDEVVFTFDKRQYNKIKSFDGYERDFQDLDIDEVALSGEFNDWSKKGWSMQKVDENIFELRKKLDDFKDKFTWEFKFVVNNFYWVEPSGRNLNSVDTTNWGFNLGVYNLKMFTAHPDENGNLSFRLDGYENAKRIVLSGTFNLWDERSFEMHKIDKGWELTLKVPPDSYEYKFIVDGNWIHDPSNSEKIENEHGSYNSIISIKSKETFFLKGYLHAEKVILAGTFNDWSEDEIEMEKTRDGWKHTETLSGGKHHYKFIVDGEWLVDPENPIMEYDYHGYINSVRMVK